MIRARLKLVLCAAAIALWGSHLGAQNCTTPSGATVQCSVSGPTFQFTARRTLNVVITPTTLSFGNPTASDYNQGYTQSSSQDYVINANSAWTLTIRTSQTSFTAVGTGARASKPRTDLSYSTVSGSGYASMPGNNAASAVQFASG